nr:immunoglobulin heavy chain junction region [Mus musculus]
CARSGYDYDEHYFDYW